MQPKGLICYDFMDSSIGLNISSSYKLKKETTPASQNHKYGSIAFPIHEGLLPLLVQIFFSESDWMFLTSTLFQGTIQCSWNKGFCILFFLQTIEKRSM